MDTSSMQEVLRRNREVLPIVDETINMSDEILQYAAFESATGIHHPKADDIRRAMAWNGWRMAVILQGGKDPDTLEDGEGIQLDDAEG